MRHETCRLCHTSSCVLYMVCRNVQCDLCLSVGGAVSWCLSTFCTVLTTRHVSRHLDDDDDADDDDDGDDDDESAAG